MTPMPMRFGWYHVSWGTEVGDPTLTQMCDLQALASAGFDLLHVSHLQDVNATRALLDAAARLRPKVGVLLEDVHPTERHHFLGHPALVGFSVADDANTKTPAQLAELCRTAGTRYISVGAGEGSTWCYGQSELVGVQLYPFPYESIASWWPAMQHARAEADRHGQRLVANLQAHDNGHGAPPSAAQVRALAWAAAAAGFDDLLWYAQAWPRGGRASRATWSAARSVMAELRRVSGRPQLTQVGTRLTATWPTRRVVLDLAASRVVSSVAR